MFPRGPHFWPTPLLASGNLPLAEKTLTDGIAIAQRNGEVFALADLQRLTGRLLLMTGSPRRRP